jgi:phosphohistidine phosphatase SixA
LVESLRSYPFDRIVSSPYPRCRETVLPLARALGIEVEARAELAPGAGLDEISSALDGSRGCVVLACTHREIFETLFLGDVTCEKAAAWVVHVQQGSVVPERYLPPPSPAVHAAFAELIG